MAYVTFCPVFLAAGMVCFAAAAQPVTLSTVDLDRITAGQTQQDIDAEYRDQIMRAGSHEEVARATEEYQALTAGGDAAGTETGTVGDNEPTSPTDEFDQTASDVTTEGEVTTSVTATEGYSTATADATAATDGGLAGTFVAADADPGIARARSEAFSLTYTLSPSLQQ